MGDRGQAPAEACVCRSRRHEALALPAAALHHLPLPCRRCQRRADPPPLPAPPSLAPSAHAAAAATAHEGARCCSGSARSLQYRVSTLRTHRERTRPPARGRSARRCGPRRPSRSRRARPPRRRSHGCGASTRATTGSRSRGSAPHRATRASSYFPAPPRPAPSRPVPSRPAPSHCALYHDSIRASSPLHCRQQYCHGTQSAHRPPDNPRRIVASASRAL